MNTTICSGSGWQAVTSRYVESGSDRAPFRYGTCRDCGKETRLTPFGLVRNHKQAVQS